MFKAEIVVVVIAPGQVTINAIDLESNRIGEVYGCTTAGDPDHIRGNLEDEPELPDGLAEAMIALQGPTLEVMKQLQQQ